MPESLSRAATQNALLSTMLCFPSPQDGYVCVHTLHIYIYIYISYTYIHTYIHTSIHPSIHPSMHACMHACMHTYVQTYRHTYIPTYLHTYVHTYMHTCIHSFLAAFERHDQSCARAHLQESVSMTECKLEERTFEHESLERTGAEGSDW